MGLVIVRNATSVIRSKDHTRARTRVATMKTHQPFVLCNNTNQSAHENVKVPSAAAHVGMKIVCT